MEFCDRALHVDRKCVKALSRRASAFVKLAGECPAPLEGVANTAADVAEAAPTPTEIEVGTGGSVDVSSLTAAESANGSASTGAEGIGQQGQTRDRWCERCGGRDGLMALALLDLEAAVEADPAGEDIRRQRDALSQEIQEEKVRRRTPWHYFKGSPAWGVDICRRRALGPRLCPCGLAGSLLLVCVVPGFR